MADFKSNFNIFIKILGPLKLRVVVAVPVTQVRVINIYISGTYRTYSYRFYTVKAFKELYKR